MAAHPKFDWQRRLLASDLTSKAKLVGMYLSTLADQNMSCYGGYRTIGERCSINKDTATKAAFELRDQGWLWITPGQKRPDGSGKSNHYVLRTVPVVGTPCPSDGDTQDQQKPRASGGADAPLPSKGRPVENRVSEREQHRELNEVIEAHEKQHRWSPDIIDTWTTERYGHPWANLTVEQKQQTILAAHQGDIRPLEP